MKKIIILIFISFATIDCFSQMEWTTWLDKSVVVFESQMSQMYNLKLKKIKAYNDSTDHFLYEVIDTTKKYTLRYECWTGKIVSSILWGDSTAVAPIMNYLLTNCAEGTTDKTKDMLICSGGTYFQFKTANNKKTYFIVGHGPLYTEIKKLKD